MEAAQARAAPVQRLADIVAGRFAVGVLGLSAATFGFWALAAPRLMPQVRVTAPETDCCPRFFLHLYDSIPCSQGVQSHRFSYDSCGIRGSLNEFVAS